jgi:hypothetical protein
MKGDIRYQLRINGKPHDKLTSDAAEVTVAESMQDASTCNVKVPIDLCKGRFELLDDDNLVPGKDKTLSVVAWIDGTQSVIFHGPITGRKVDLKHGGAGSSVELTATDRRVELDRTCRKYESHSGSVGNIVEGLIGNLRQAKKDVDPFSKIQYKKGTGPLNQTVSDLALIRKLADAVNAEFWLDWELKGDSIVETAHFKSPTKPKEGKVFGMSLPLPIAGAKKAQLKMNSGDGTSTLLSFTSERKSEVPQKSGTIFRVDPRTGELKSSEVKPSTKRLGSDPPKQEISCEVLSAGGVENARDKAEAALNDASWITEATAETTVFALCGLVRPRTFVDVVGLGDTESGEYLVWSVNHTITPAEHRMKLSLKRNAVGGK